MPDAAILWASLTALVSASAILWLQYFDLKDSLRPEPRGRQFMAFGLGAVAAVALHGAELHDRARSRLDHGHRSDRAVVGEELRHASLASQK